jgi:hypothetical protein
VIRLLHGLHITTPARPQVKALVEVQQLRGPLIGQRHIVQLRPGPLSIIRANQLVILLVTQLLPCLILHIVQLPHGLHITTPARPQVKALVEVQQLHGPLIGQRHIVQLLLIQPRTQHHGALVIQRLLRGQHHIIRVN